MRRLWNSTAHTATICPLENRRLAPTQNPSSHFHNAGTRQRERSGRRQSPQPTELASSCISFSSALPTPTGEVCERHRCPLRGSPGNGEPRYTFELKCKTVRGASRIVAHHVKVISFSLFLNPGRPTSRERLLSGRGAEAREQRPWARCRRHLATLSVRFQDRPIGGLVPTLGRNPPLTHP